MQQQFGNRKTIAYLTNQHIDMLREPIWRAVVKQAEVHDVNLLTLFTWQFSRSDGHDYDYDACLQLLTHSPVDGLLLSPRIMEMRTPNRVDGLLKELSHIPTVLFGEKREGYPSVYIEHHVAQEQMYRHLFEDCKRQNIAICIENEAWDVQDGWVAGYKHYHKKYKVPINESLIFYGIRSRFDVDALIKRIEDSGGRFPDAFIMPGYRHASQVIMCLKKNHMLVPEDVSVICREDVEANRFMDPSLTSIDTFYKLQASMAMDLLCRMVKNNEPGEVLTEEANFTIRESCITPDASWPQQWANDWRYRDSDIFTLLGEKREQILEGIVTMLAGEEFYKEIEDIESHSIEYLSGLINEILESLLALDKPIYYMRTQRLLRTMSSYGFNAFTWLKPLFVLQKAALICETEAEKILEINNMLLDSMAVVHDYSWRQNRLEELGRKKRSESRRTRGLARKNIGFDAKSANKAIAQRASLVGIHQFAVCLFEDPKGILGRKRVLIASNEEEIIELKDDDVYVAPDQALPSQIFDFEQRVSLVISPIDNVGLQGMLIASHELDSNQHFLALRPELIEHARNNAQIKTMQKQSVELIKLNDSLHNEIEMRRQAEQELSHLVLHDPLTSLPNRVLFFDRINQSVEKLRRDKSYDFSLLYIDLDGFKSANDTYGHSAGDEVLKTVSDRMSQCVRRVDTLARIGGDEFAILIEGHDSAKQIADRIHTSLHADIELEDANIAIKASIGIAFSHALLSEVDELMESADEAMYRAKNTGGGQTVIYGEKNGNPV